MENNNHSGNLKYNPKAIFSWCLYDFANSPFTTLTVTFVYATYFTKAFAADEIVGTSLWSTGITVSAIIVALLSPILGAVADRGGYRKLFLFLTTAVTIIGSAILYKFEPGQTVQALLWFVIANIAFEMGMVFYNAFLPDISPPGRIGRISGYGWSLGYIGGLLALVVALTGLINPKVPWFGFSTDNGENIRATNLLVAVWFIIFSIPIFLWVKEDKSRISKDRKGIITSGVRQLVNTFHEVRRYRQIVRLLLARLFYNDGLITIFAFGGIYAGDTFHFSYSEIIIFGIVLNIAAGAGAFVMGFLDDRLGGKKTIQISLYGLIIATVIAVLSPNKILFWIAGIIVGIFSGPNQATSRSLMGRFVPPDKENEFFGFFAFSGKATAFMGPFLFGRLTKLFYSQRVGISAVLIFFIVGALFLVKVDETEGKTLAKREIEQE
jgi:UMF1 family MFS transporter